MTVAARIIAKFGGVRPCARALDLPPTTVQSWQDTGLIPAKQQQGVLDAAVRLGIEVSPADFFNLPGEAVEGEPTQGAVETGGRGNLSAADRDQADNRAWPAQKHDLKPKSEAA